VGERCLSCDSRNIGYPIKAVAPAAGPLYVQKSEALGFSDLVVTTANGRILSLDDVDTSKGLCLDCGTGWSA